MGRLVKLVASIISLAEAFRIPFEALVLCFLQLTVVEAFVSVGQNSGRYEWDGL